MYRTSNLLWFCVAMKSGLMLLEECKLGVFKKGMLTRIFGSRRNAATEGCRELYNEGFLNFQC
jgi:hypothetical protein